jgi:hypothetical protein
MIAKYMEKTGCSFEEADKEVSEYLEVSPSTKVLSLHTPMSGSGHHARSWIVLFCW